MNKKQHDEQVKRISELSESGFLAAIGEMEPFQRIQIQAARDVYLYRKKRDLERRDKPRCPANACFHGVMV